MSEYLFCGFLLTLQVNNMKHKPTKESQEILYELWRGWKAKSHIFYKLATFLGSFQCASIIVAS